MKKTAAAKKLLLSTERVRSLDAASMRNVQGGALIVCGVSGNVCANNTNQQPPPCPASCTIGGITTVRCINTEAN